jgi:predicted secreted acid phosphatase
MQKRLVVPALCASLVLAFAGCTVVSSSSPAASAPAAAVAPASNGEPYNLYLLKQELKAYIDEGRYEAGLAAVAAEAKQWVEQRAVRATAGEKLAVVFDLDETLLSNLQHMRGMDFGYVPKLWDEWVAEGDATAIVPVRDVYLAARARNLTIVFITGRKTSDQPGTEKNLRAAGIGGYSRIFYKPNGFAGTTEAFKTATRRKLVEEEGYTIIANIGDQASDLAGGFSERTFKLPNPFYIAK